MSPRKESAETELSESRWKWLYIVSGITALITALLIVVQAVVSIVWPTPGTALDAFNLFQNDTLLGFLALDLLPIINNIFLIPILLALYISLRKTNESFTLIAMALGFIGIAAYFASNPVVSMYTLGGQYAAATTEAERALFVTSGEVALAAFAGTSYHVSLILESVALAVLSMIMLQDKRFTKDTATLGILANFLALGLYVPTYRSYILLFSIAFLSIWYILIARSFFNLGRDLPDDIVNKKRRFQFLSWRKIRRRMIRWVFRHMSFAVPVKRLRETSTLMAFHHPKPTYPLHILLTTKRPFTSLMDIPATDTTFMRELLETVQSLIKEYQLEESGYRLITNGGIYQDVSQLHFHLVSDEVK